MKPISLSEKVYDKLKIKDVFRFIVSMHTGLKMPRKCWTSGVMR